MTIASATPGANRVPKSLGTGLLDPAWIPPLPYRPLGDGHFAEDITSDGSIKSSSPSQGIGYATGAGGTVTQTTSKSTAVTLNAMCGTITLMGDAIVNNFSISFTFNNTAIADGDTVIVLHNSVGSLGLYGITATPSEGSALVTVRNLRQGLGSLAEAIVLRFVVIKTVVA